MNRPRITRWLRIGWSAACVIGCVLLLALWVRSQWWIEMYSIKIPPSIYVGVSSYPGTCGIEASTMPNGKPWTLYTEPSDDPRTVSMDSIVMPNYSRTWGEFGHKFASFDGTPHGSIIVPFWFAILVAALIAPAPWIRWRFSLRTAFIALTVVAVVLGCAMWAMRK